MLKEIGSEFWEVESTNKIYSKFDSQSIFMLSGRTALDFIIRDVMAQKSFKRVYMPSYCCHSMIEPFLKHGVEVIFYDVSINDNGGLKFDIDININCDAIFVMQYFGYHDNQVNAISKTFSNKGITVIEDITHSAFCKHPNSKYADYIFGSYRKWTGLASGAVVKKIRGNFLIDLPTKTSEEYCSMRRKAALLKRAYISKGSVDSKKTYLNEFERAEEYLSNDYQNYLIDYESFEKIKFLNTDKIIQKRRNNAGVILNNLYNLNYIKPIFNLNEEDVPLFVPVLLNVDIRDDFNNYLKKNNIFCPIHWPLSKIHNISTKSKEIYTRILSLVCDQRYGEEEIHFLCNVLRKFKG